MRDIHCPKDIGLKNTFSGEDCEKEQYYNNCYHCWSTALAKEKEQLREQIAKTGYWTRVTDKTGHLVWECDCGWQQRFATNYCPNCGKKMIKTGK